MTVRRLLLLASRLTVALLLLAPVLAQAGALPPVGACCEDVPGVPLICRSKSQISCENSGFGTYQGDGTVCGDHPFAHFGICGGPPHYQCYDVDRAAFDPVTLALDDEIGTSTATVRRPKMLCAPVNKNDEDPNAPTIADHLVGYELRRGDRVEGAPFRRVVDQFGSLVLDLRRPERILVPSAKSLTDPATPLAAPGVDHYQCYSVRGDRRRVAGVTVEDQFGTGTTAVKKPSRLCLPVDKNGEGILHTPSLMCYAIKRGPRVNTTVYVDNQFGPARVRVRRARELCLPSTRPCVIQGSVTASQIHEPEVSFGSPEAECTAIGATLGIPLVPTGRVRGIPGRSGAMSVTGTAPSNIDFAGAKTHVVYVKAGTGGHSFWYSTGTTEGAQLTSPKDHVSHVTFCLNTDLPPVCEDLPFP